MDIFNPLVVDEKLNPLDEHLKQKDNDPYAYDSDMDDKEKFEKGIAAQSGNGGN